MLWNTNAFNYTREVAQTNMHFITFINELKCVLCFQDYDASNNLQDDWDKCTEKGNLTYKSKRSIQTAEQGNFSNTPLTEF